MNYIIQQHSNPLKLLYVKPARHTFLQKYHLWTRDRHNVL